MKDSHKHKKSSFVFLPYIPAISLKDVVTLLVPCISLVILFFIHKQIEELQFKIHALDMKPSKIEEFTVAPYPILQNEKIYTALPITSQINQESSSIVSANAAIIIDNDSQIVLFSKNPTTIFPMASTTKIMTALVALEAFNLSDILTVQVDNVDGAVVGIKTGEQFLFENLLYAMLLPSGNDAALAIAQNYPGGESAFVKRMNDKAKELYLESTSFRDVTGLSEGNKSTAYDLARLSSFAMKNSFFSKIVGSKHKMITNLDGKVYSLTNLNRLLGIEGVNGIKTGFTEEAGEVLTTSRVYNGRSIISVVMKSKNRFSDTESLLSFINKSLTYLEVDSLLKN